MSEKKNNTTCESCGRKRKTTTIDNLNCCADCITTAKLIREQPDAVKKLWREYRDEPILIKPQIMEIDSEADVPDVLDGKRYRTVDREFNKWYLSVSEIEGSPVEIFASTAFDRDHQLQSRISNLTTITRLISLILRHVVLGERLTLDKCLKQLQRSSRQPDDLPDMLYGVLSKYNTHPLEKQG